MKAPFAFFFAACLPLACAADDSGAVTEALSVPATSADITPGQRVRVSLAATSGVVGIEPGLPVPAGSSGLVATRVEISDHPGKDSERGRIAGTVAGIDTSGATLKVLGMTILIDVSTRFEGVADLTALTPGRIVEIEGELVDNGQFAASKVRALAPALSGTVQSVGASGADRVINLLGHPVTVNSQTVVVRKVRRHGRHHGGDEGGHE